MGLQEEKKSILVVDDHKSIYDSVCMLFGGIYNLLYAKDCIKAKQICIDGRSPDLVLLDIMMPGESGLDFLQSIEEKRSNIPVIILSAYDGQEALQACRTAFRYGAADYIKKPFNPEDLKDSIQRIFYTPGRTAVLS